MLETARAAAIGRIVAGSIENAPATWARELSLFRYSSGWILFAWCDQLAHRECG